MANPQQTQQGIDTRDRIVELIAKNVDEGGDGLTRAALARELGLSTPTLHRHVSILLKDERVEEGAAHKLTPSKHGHVHICRTCGEHMHPHKE